MDKAAAALARMKGPAIPLSLCFDETGALDHQVVVAYVDWLSEQGAPCSHLKVWNSFKWYRITRSNFPSC